MLSYSINLVFLIMKSFFCIPFQIIILFMCMSCVFTPSKDDQEYQYQNYEEMSQVVSKDGKNQSTSKEKGKQYQNIYDSSNGMVKMSVPLPQGWKISTNENDPIQIKAPNGIKVGKTNKVEYFYSQDPFKQQSAQMMGKEIAPVVSIENIVQQQLVPMANSQGYTLIKSYALHKVQQFWQRFSMAMPQTGSNRYIYAMGTEWKNTTGEYSFILVFQIVTENQGAYIWNVQTTEMEAPSNYFMAAKKAYIYGLENTIVNPQWQQFKNKQLIGNIQRDNAFWAQASRASAAAHQSRMNAIQSRGNSSSTIAKINSDILDINHSGYLKRDNIKDHGHSKSVNAIAGKAIIGNHSTGEHYTVTSGSNHYWVNSEGTYFGTDNPLYDPRVDQNINQTEWTYFEIEN